MRVFHLLSQTGSLMSARTDGEISSFHIKLRIQLARFVKVIQKADFISMNVKNAFLCITHCEILVFSCTHSFRILYYFY